MTIWQAAGVLALAVLAFGLALAVVGALGTWMEGGPERRRLRAMLRYPRSGESQRRAGAKRRYWDW